MARLLLLLGIAAGLFFLLRWLSRQPPRVHWQVFAIALALVMLLLVLTGRAHWLAAVFAALLPFARALLSILGGIPGLKRVLGGMGAGNSKTGPSSGQTSTVASKYIRMTLDHDSGDINGEVLGGKFQGRKLDQMSFDDLLQLLHECRDDEESVSLLQAFLERMHGDSWQERAGDEQPRAPGSPGEMSRAEAFQVLGLDPGASEAEIIEAHRRLMQKLHPDRGGTAYLAARINQAKDILLGD